jgi:hypothetical protein
MSANNDPVRNVAGAPLPCRCRNRIDDLGTVVAVAEGRADWGNVIHTADRAENVHRLMREAVDPAKAMSGSKPVRLIGGSTPVTVIVQATLSGPLASS